MIVYSEHQTELLVEHMRNIEQWMAERMPPEGSPVQLAPERFEAKKSPCVLTVNPKGTDLLELQCGSSCYLWGHEAGDWQLCLSDYKSDLFQRPENMHRMICAWPELKPQIVEWAESLTQAAELIETFKV